MSDADPRVAVVVITYNRRDEVLRSLAHLTALPEQPRIALVDNGSADGTAAAVTQRYPQVEVLDAGGNLGASGRTLGVRHVEAPYVALCDDDTWWEPGSLRRAADLFDRHPRLATLTACVLVGPENRKDPACTEMEQSPLPRELEMPGAPLLGFLAGASVVRRTAFLEAGGFEPRFFIGGEEELLAVDLASRGWWLCYVPELVVHHYPSQQRDVAARR
jgi:GT2 family glycosyltransferase